ncbi:MAG: hypothetical protein HGA87_00980 [Desulfobulbaceae bacterium]|nr:hypothetical protein [Desulfobulbaceae bacterium]
MGFFSSIFNPVQSVMDVFTGRDAQQDIKAGAQTAADAQTEALDYLKQVEALPQEYRESALQQLGMLYGFSPPEGTPISSGVMGKDAFYESLKQDPFYQNKMQVGEDAIMRQAGQTGGLRSGNVQDALSRYSGDVFEQTYNKQLAGLSGLAGLSSYAPQISQGIAGIGQTQAQGMIAGAQARETAKGQLMGMISGGARAYAGGGI